MAEIVEKAKIYPDLAEDIPLEEPSELPVLVKVAVVVQEVGEFMVIDHYVACLYLIAEPMGIFQRLVSIH